MASIINASSSGSGGIVQTADASGVLQLQSNGSVAVTVDTSLNVGFGTTAPAKLVSLNGTSASTTTVGIGMLIANTNTTVDSRAGITFVNFDNYGASIWSPRTGSTAGALVFGANNSAGTAETNIVEVGRFNYTGNLVLKGGTATANGVGITFPASQSASTDANCLDDYEEGTWTPTILNGGVTFSAVASATYTKIGRMVYIQLDVTISSNSNGNPFVITGQPFALTGSYYAGLSMGYNTSATNAIAVVGSAGLEFYAPTGSSSISNQNFSGSRIIVAGCYEAP